MIVIFCQNVDNASGWGTYTFQYAKITNSFEKTIIICHKKNKNLNIKQYELLSYSKDYRRNPIKIIFDAFKIKKILNKFDDKPKLHVTVETYALLIPFLKNHFSKILLTCHGSLFNQLTIRENLIINFLFKKAIKLTDKIIFVSNYTKKKINTKIQKIKKIKTEVISNCIDFKKRKPKKKQKKIFNILCLSAIKPRKGQLNLIKSIKILNKKIKNFKVFLSGSVQSQSYLNKIKSLISDAQMEKKIKFTGFVNEKKKDELFKKSDLFVLLSEDTNLDFEGYGLVYLEALSYGLPTIVSTQCGCSEINFKNNSGLVVNPRNYKKISQFIYSITKKNISKISPECIKTASKYDWKNKTAEIKRLYN